MIPTAAQLARYKKFLVTIANLLAVVLSLGVLDGKALVVALGAVAVLNSLGVVSLSNDTTLPKLTEIGKHRVVKL